MTEEEWLTAAYSEAPLRFLENRVSDRKLRLLGVECCWDIADLRVDTASRRRINVIEQFVEGCGSVVALDEVANEAWHEAARWREVGPWSPPVDSKEWDEKMDRGKAHEAVAYLATMPTRERPLIDLMIECLVRVESLVYGEYGWRPLLHDIVGNPFHPVTADPSWLTSTVTALARGIYADRAFDRLPILTDALQDAGCDHAEVLAHCRGDGPHARGCWVVDLILGKS